MAQLAARGLPGVATLVANLFSEEGLDRARRGLADAEVLVLDPPREGLRGIAALLGKKHSLREVLYVSCDLATFARDAAVLVAAGFVMEEVQPLDLFPQGPHLELLSRFRHGGRRARP